MDEAEYCNRISVMVDGRIEALDSPKAIREDLGAANMEDAFYTLARRAKRSAD
jgi:ABC-2 type transport system ATP-binding protein